MARELNFASEAELRRMRDRLAFFKRRLARVNKTATSASSMLAAKRFRVAVFATPLTLLGSPVSQTVRWSTPMPSDVYNVDAACSGVPAQAWSYTVSEQDANGCKVTFSAPVLLAAGTIVVVLAVAPASA